MTIERVNLRLNERTVDNKGSLWGNIKADMTSNSNFTAINPSLATIDIEMVKLANYSSAAKSGDHSKVGAMNAQEIRTDNLLHQLGLYVEGIANAAALTGGDAVAIIKSAGMDVVAKRTKAALPDAPAGLKGTSTIEGDAVLSWKGVKRARCFVIEISSDINVLDPTGTTGTGTQQTGRAFVKWEIKDVTTKTKITIPGLTSGVKYAFRIYALGTAGKGAPSAVVVIKVL